MYCTCVCTQVLHVPLAIWLRNGGVGRPKKEGETGWTGNCEDQDVAWDSSGIEESTAEYACVGRLWV